MAQRRGFLVVAVLAAVLGSAVPTVGSGAAPGTPAAPGGRSAPAGSSSAPWSQVDGTEGQAFIADADGRALQFRGINVKADHPAEIATDDLLADAEARGFDLLRLAVFWDQLEPTDDAWDEAYAAEIQTVIERADAHGIWVILDMHQDNFNQQFEGKGIPDWVTDGEGLPFTPQPVWFLNALQPALQAAWENLYERPAFREAQIDAWEEIVTRYRDEPNVLGYDLLNEPFGKFRPDEDFAAAIERVESVQLTAMYQRLTTAIRKLDADRWVFIEAPNQASLGIRTWLGPIEGGNIAFFPHLYDPAIESATYTPGGSVAYDPTFFETYEGVIDVYPDANHVPVLFGEWGVAHPEVPGMDRYVQGALELMERQGSGWAAFTGCRGSGYCVFDADGNDRPGIGQITQPWAKAIAGAPTSYHWDGATETLRVVFEDSAATGATDLVVPASRAYPDGYRVTTSDADGTWSSSVTSGTDPGPLMVSVTVARTGRPHAICVSPASSTTPCEAPDGGPEAPTTTVAPPATVPGGVGPAGGARPVAGSPAYTG